MADFGEQLRTTHEDKGMTQQSLAEKLYVTRQAVSRWEGGNITPTLLTVKKLAQVLDVDAGDLLSDDETRHIAERNPIVEKETVNHITLVLFTGIVVSYLISVIGIFIRIPSFAGQISASDVWVSGGNLLSELIGIVAFVAGFICILRSAFSPKKVGAVMMAVFASVCIKGLAILTTGAVITDWFAALIPAILGVVGSVAAYFYFRQKQSSRIWYCLVIIVSVLGIIRAPCTVAVMVAYATQNTNTLSRLLKKMAVIMPKSLKKQFMTKKKNKPKQLRGILLRSYGVIPIVIIGVIVVLWFTGIIPKQIEKTSGAGYVNKHCHEMQLKVTNVEYADAF